MRLNEILEHYLNEHNISVRSFAKRCGLSHGYIAMMVKGINSRSNTPMIPTIKSLNCIARGMGLSLDELLSMMDDTIIELSSDVPMNKADEFVRLFSQLNDAQQSMIIASMKGILSHED